MRRLFAAVLTATLAVGWVAAVSATPVAAQADDEEPTLEEPDAEAPTPERGYEKGLRRAIDDIQDYWADEFVPLYSRDYERIPDDRIYALTSQSEDLPECDGETIRYAEVELNAVYVECEDESNFVAYDDEQLFPYFYNEFGTFSVAFILAHEFGHAVQDRAEEFGIHLLIEHEQQADCFAGAWAKHVADGESEKFELEPGDLDAALPALLSLRDTVGDLIGQHGNGFDRVRAFQDGYEGGAGVCADYTRVGLPPLTQIEFTTEQEAAAGGNLPPDEVLPATVELLNAYYEATVPDVYEPLSIDDIRPYDTTEPLGELPECDGDTPPRDELTNRVLYCAADRYVAFDESYVQTVYESVGDFAVLSLLANAWATHVQTLQDFPGVEDNEASAAFGADCYTGAFTRALFDEDLLVGDDGEPEYRLSPGDLDETVQALLNDAQVRGVDPTADSTFVRVQTFRNGFLGKYELCSAFAGEDPTGEENT